MSGRTATLAGRLMTAQALVIAVGGVTLAATAAIVAPGLFRSHLMRTGEDSPDVQLHAQQAFDTAFAISLALSMVLSLVAAVLVSWFLVRRVAHPVEELADAAEQVAGGTYAVEVPDAGFSSELARLADSFEHMASRLAETEVTRTRMLADLAHELRTPMATLEAYIDGLEDGVVPDDPTSYATMREQIARLRRLAGDLREAAAADEHALHLVFTAVDPGEAAAAAVAAAQPRYVAKDVVLQVVAAPSPCVRADRERLQQVLANLLDNALRHTSSGGTVRVEVHPAGSDVVLSVRDDGDGIPSEELGLVFDRFHRVDPSRASTDGSGSGLGLTIARAIVLDHGGTISVGSDGPGTGATFIVALPAVP